MVAIFFSIECAFNKLGGVEFLPVDCKVVEVVVVEVVVLSVAVVLVDVVVVGVVDVIAGLVVVKVLVVGVGVVDIVVSLIVSSFSLILLILSTLSISVKVVLNKVPLVLFAATACKFLTNVFPKKAPRSNTGGICLFCLLDVLTVQ